MANFDNIHELIDETIYPNSAGEINATEHNAMLHDVVDAVNTKKADQDDLEQEIEDRESHDDLIWQSLFQSWASSTAYKVGDIRRYEGGLYICITAHTSGLSFDSSKWDYYSGATIKQMIDGITAKIPAEASSSNKLATTADVAEVAAYVLDYGGYVDAGEVLTALGEDRPVLMRYEGILYPLAGYRGEDQYQDEDVILYFYGSYHDSNYMWAYDDNDTASHWSMGTNEGWATRAYVNYTEEQLTLKIQQKLYVAQYGVTAFAQIKAAYNQGSIVQCKKDGKIYRLWSIEDDGTNKKAHFSLVGGNDEKFLDVVDLMNGTWSQTYYDLATANALTTGLATKVDKVTGKGLSTNDYTDAEKAKVAENARDIEALKGQQDKLGNAHAIDIDTDFGYKRNGKAVVIFGVGAPSAATIPDQAGIPFFIGQQYIDTTASSSGLWYAAGTTSVSDWKKA